MNCINRFVNSSSFGGVFVRCHLIFIFANLASGEIDSSVLAEDVFTANAVKVLKLEQKQFPDLNIPQEDGSLSFHLLAKHATAHIRITNGKIDFIVREANARYSGTVTTAIADQVLAFVKSTDRFFDPNSITDQEVYSRVCDGNTLLICQGGRIVAIRSPLLMYLATGEHFNDKIERNIEPYVKCMFLLAKINPAFYSEMVGSCGRIDLKMQFEECKKILENEREEIIKANISGP